METVGRLCADPNCDNIITRERVSYCCREHANMARGRAMQDANKARGYRTSIETIKKYNCGDKTEEQMEKVERGRRMGIISRNRKEEKVNFYLVQINEDNFKFGVTSSPERIDKLLERARINLDNPFVKIEEISGQEAAVLEERCFYLVAPHLSCNSEFQEMVHHKGLFGYSEVRKMSDLSLYLEVLEEK